MRWLPWLEVLILWCAWMYPFLFRAPWGQKRESITVSGPTYLGLFFEVLAIGLALALRGPEAGLVRMAVALVFGVVAVVMGWTAVTHLGKQFRVRAGLYEGHELVRSGPYAMVRHPIYASLLGMLICTLLVFTPWRWMVVSIAAFVVGTEIRVRTEDRLLGSRFGDEFLEYQRKVPAYVPFVR